MANDVYVYGTKKPCTHILQKYNKIGFWVEKNKDISEWHDWVEKWKEKDSNVTDMFSAMEAHTKKYAQKEKSDKLAEFFDEFYKVFPKCKDAYVLRLNIDKDTWKVVKGKEVRDDLSKFIKSTFSLVQKLP